jgi:hypothetical protein
MRTTRIKFLLSNRSSVQSRTFVGCMLKCDSPFLPKRPDKVERMCDTNVDQSGKISPIPRRVWVVESMVPTKGITTWQQKRHLEDDLSSR